MSTVERRPDRVRPSRLRAAAAASLLAVLAALAGCDAAGEPTTLGDPATSSAPTSEATVTDPTEQPTTEATDESTSASPTGSGDPSTSTSPSGSPSADPEQPPSTYQQAVQRVDGLERDGVTVVGLKRFSTTGDTVYCVLEHRFIPAGCELGKGAVRDAEVCANALADTVGRIEFTEQGALPQCNTDTIREPGAEVVTAPGLASRGQVTCAVEEIGVTCIDKASGTGFFLTPGSYAAFG